MAVQHSEVGPSRGRPDQRRREHAVDGLHQLPALGDRPDQALHADGQAAVRGAVRRAALAKRTIVESFGFQFGAVSAADGGDSIGAGSAGSSALNPDRGGVAAIAI